MIYLLLFIFISFFLVFAFWRSKFIVRLLSLILGGLCFYAVLYYVTYNNDWDVYLAIFNGHIESGDFFFNIVSSSLSDRGYEYVSVYRLHIFLIGIFFFFFISRSSYADIFSIIIIYLTFQVVPVSNQIRYYLSFSLFLVAVYSRIIHKSKFRFIFFSTFSILSHFGIVLMFPFLFFFNSKDSRHYVRNLLLTSLILALIIYLTVGLDYLLSTVYSSYLDFDSFSSIPGGLFNNTIWLLWLIFVFYINRRIEKQVSTDLQHDIKFQFLYRLSLYCIVFYPSSIVIQILSHRYIAASTLVWLTFYFYSLNFEVSKQGRFFSLTLFLVLITLTFSYIYILPTILLGISTVDSVLLLFTSNDFINKLTWIN